MQPVPREPAPLRAALTLTEVAVTGAALTTSLVAPAVAAYRDNLYLPNARFGITDATRADYRITPGCRADSWSPRTGPGA